MRPRTVRSKLAELALPGAPLGFQVFTHIKIARHRIANDLPEECKGEGFSNLPFRQTAAQLNRVSVERACQIARDELSLVNSLYASTLLLEQRSVSLINSCPWFSNSPGSLTSIGHFYFAQFRTFHLAATA